MTSMKSYINGKKWARKELKIIGLQPSGTSSTTVLCWIWNVRGVHTPAIGSDHTPIILSTCPPKKRKRKNFKYEAFWAEEEECMSLVRDTWAAPDS